MGTRTRKLKEAGQSLWLDNIQRRELHDNTLKNMIVEDGICGVTSNPTIFMNAVSKSLDYDDQIAGLARERKVSSDIYHAVTIEDIRDAAKLFLPVYEESGKNDGFVSIEINPQLAFNVEESIKEARAILSEIGLPNIMIKVPSTKEGVLIIRQLISEGINVNATLIFSPECCRDVALAYIAGLEDRLNQGKDVSGIRSVASFFLSRIDTNVDKLIDEISEDSASLLRGKAAVSVAKVTYLMYNVLFSDPRFLKLKEKGASVQRLLWASTGTKDPAYSDVKYVEELIVNNTVNTLPPKTIDAFRDHGEIVNSFESGLDEGPSILSQIEACGIDLNKAYEDLQAAGVKSFEKSYLDLLDAISEKGMKLISE
jgi:transaldolase